MSGATYNQWGVSELSAQSVQRCHRDLRGGPRHVAERAMSGDPEAEYLAAKTAFVAAHKWDLRVTKRALERYHARQAA